MFQGGEYFEGRENQIFICVSRFRYEDCCRGLRFYKCFSEKGLSPNTVKSYLEDLKVFYLWLKQESLKFYEVKPSDIPNFIEFIDNRKVSGMVSPATLNRYLATISSFYRYFEVVGGFIEESPLVKVKGYYPKVHKGYLKHIPMNWDKRLNNYFRRKVRKKPIENYYKRKHYKVTTIQFQNYGREMNL